MNEFLTSLDDPAFADISHCFLTLFGDCPFGRFQDYAKMEKRSSVAWPEMLGKVERCYGKSCTFCMLMYANVVDFALMRNSTKKEKNSK